MSDVESDRIQQLDATTVERIAAGEVVERPASVVKELVENSLDAGASRVDVTVDGGGTDRIVVSDDGEGMSEADVRAAVQKHTTSKISDIEDLESGVATLGFRGEALHTIGAVSRTTITTRPQDGDEEATELRLEGGEVTRVGPAGRPPGTTVEVEDLFYNTPARRKYLKTDSTEFGHVNRVVTRYALANPDVAVSLTHDDREVFATTGQGDLQGTLLSVYGREVAEAMIPVDSEGEAVGRVHGYVSDPETTRASREYVSTFVNGRYVSDSLLREAVVSAYGGQLAADRYPFAVLFVEVPAGEVDVNVHPRKMEVRFGESETVKREVESAVEDALLDAGLIRTSAPRGRSQPDEASIAPSRQWEEDDDAADEADTSWHQHEMDATGDSDETERASGPVESDETGRRDGFASTDAASTDEGAETGWSAPGDADTDAADASADEEPATDQSGNSASTASTDVSVPDEGDTDRVGSNDGSAGADDRRFRAATENARLGETAGDERADDQFDRLPRLRVLGQLHDTYLVAESPDGLVLVDQHAADERINYERLQAELDGETTSQTLVAPVTLELTAAEAAVFGDALAALRDLGFEATLDDREATVTAVPAVFDDALDPEVLRDALAAFLDTDGDHGETVAEVRDHLLADLACYPSVTGNTSLREGDVVALLTELDACENPWACPHGRPVVVRIDEGELEDRFERDYPGHQIRRPE
ncbi:DNA mismatch repair endonuclease MutL [Halospeciosus flavus]|uniref:DNA mismatch repair protein MutL n=1 Tax=Halospeciosus flavus TaxID=3032283 RepID=A0ABD5Z582_9EURY|nr:DNA mismatch repair endonuclease MutL [Halospeciosus flavus]